MTTEQVIAVHAPAGVRQPVRSHQTLADYWALTKPEVNFLIAIATFAGFYLGYPGRLHDFPVLRLIHTLLGTLLVAGGTATLNQYIERHYDAQMRRTARRPVASLRIKPPSALWFGIGLAVAGSAYLAIAVNTLSSLLAVLTALSYLFLYTPLKRETPLCTFIGAIPGAAPTLIGWAAAQGNLTQEAWLLYGILFLWQFPHFMAIAWMYREDYDRAGYRMLPAGSSRAGFAVLQTILPLLALIPLSSFATPLGFYRVPALLLGLGFLYFGKQFALRRSNLDARRLLLTSIVYLPALFLAMILAHR